MNIAELQLTQHLKSHGYSVTSARHTVFAALEDKEAISMAELVTACGDKLDRATVYRTITLFEELGIVRRVQIGWKYKLELTDAFSNHHHHLTCTMCGSVTPLSEDIDLEERLNELATLYKFQPTDHQLEIRGLCHTCQTVYI